jgi:hypothetical protein
MRRYYKLSCPRFAICLVREKHREGAKTLLKSAVPTYTSNNAAAAYCSMLTFVPLDAAKQCKQRASVQKLCMKFHMNRCAVHYEMKNSETSMTHAALTPVALCVQPYRCIESTHTHTHCFVYMQCMLIEHMAAKQPSPMLAPV